MNPQSKAITEKLINMLNETVIPCEISNHSFCENMGKLIGNARIVLMGESTHGTLEFYQARIALSEYLIRNKGFQAIAIEGDWTSAYPAHCYIQGKGNPDKPENALTEFHRFPEWMWRNDVMAEFLKHLRDHNDQIADQNQKVGFYGLDLYCLNESIHVVIEYLQKHYPEIAKKAKADYACLDHTPVDPQFYGYLTGHHLKKACSKEVTAQLLELYRISHQPPSYNSQEIDQPFYALQNARVIKNAECYYRALFESNHMTWNIRDQHMADTVQNIMSHLESKTRQPAKIIIWAHNSHVGDARATEMAERQELNLGQLMRERFYDISFLLGFSTAQGTVMAASQWGSEGQHKKINSPIPGSYEWLFQALEAQNFILTLRQDNALTHLLKASLLQRAIGVIYRAETERTSHYFFTRLPYQFDTIIHLNDTHAIPHLSQKAWHDLAWN